MTRYSTVKDSSSLSNNARICKRIILYYHFYERALILANLSKLIPLLIMYKSILYLLLYVLVMRSQKTSLTCATLEQCFNGFCPWFMTSNIIHQWSKLLTNIGTKVKIDKVRLISPARKIMRYTLDHSVMHAVNMYGACMHAVL